MPGSFPTAELGGRRRAKTERAVPVLAPRRPPESARTRDPKRSTLIDDVRGCRLNILTLLTAVRPGLDRAIGRYSRAESIFLPPDPSEPKNCIIACDKSFPSRPISFAGREFARRASGDCPTIAVLVAVTSIDAYRIGVTGAHDPMW